MRNCLDCGVTVVRTGSRGAIPQRCPNCTRLHKNQRIYRYQRQATARATPEQLAVARQQSRLRTAKSRAKHIDKIRAADREKKRQIASDPVLRARASQMHRAANLKRFYGLTIERYEALLAEQGGVCAICHDASTDGRRLHIDHDHACCPGKKSCGKCVRGLLCNLCNMGLARFRDNPEYLDAAKRYLQKVG